MRIFATILNSWEFGVGSWEVRKTGIAISAEFGEFNLRTPNSELL
jgi:hypothetical protein